MQQNATLMQNKPNFSVKILCQDYCFSLCVFFFNFYSYDATSSSILDQRSNVYAEKNEVDKSCTKKMNLIS